MNSSSNNNYRVREVIAQTASPQIADSRVKCYSCGGTVAVDDEICPHCGARLTSEDNVSIIAARVCGGEFGDANDIPDDDGRYDAWV